MSRTKEPFNPFYILLTIVGILFTISACAYCVLLLQESRRGAGFAIEEPVRREGIAGRIDDFMAFLARRGTEVLSGQLVVLAVLTVGAIGLDHSRRTEDSPAVGAENGAA